MENCDLSSAPAHPNITVRNKREEDVSEPSFIELLGPIAPSSQPEQSASSNDNDKKTSIIEVCQIIQSTEGIMKFLKSKKLIKESCYCNKCYKEMTLRTRNSTNDGVSWFCSKCKTTKSIREDSMFQASKLKLDIQVLLLYIFSTAVPVFIARVMLPDLSKNAI